MLGFIELEVFLAGQGPDQIAVGRENLTQEDLPVTIFPVDCSLGRSIVL